MKDCFYQQELLKLLKQASQILTGENPHTSSLREIQQFVWDTRFQPTISGDDRFLMFFLDSYIEKIFFNLVGDVPYKKGVTKEIQTQFYKELGELLFCFNEKLQQEALSSAYPLYVRLGELYLKTVDRLNNNLATHDAQHP